MDEHGMENEHLEQQRLSTNTEYQPTKCRVTKPPPPKPATNPLQFIKVPPPPQFQKVKEQVNKVEVIKKERKEIQDEAEDWQANLDNWKSSRRKLQGHIIERVVEVKKFEQEDNGRSHRRSKTFNEILEERGKSKYTIPIYLDESNDWSDLGISDSKGNSQENKTQHQEQLLMGTSNLDANEENYEKKQSATLDVEHNLNLTKNNIKLNNNNYNILSSQIQLDTKPNNVSKNGQYTYEGAIEGYRSTIKSRIDNSVFVKIADMPRRTSEVETLVPKGEIVKRKELIVKQQEDITNIPNTTNRVLQDFENSISIKQRMKNLEKCNDQAVRYVDNINIKPKVKQISQIFDKPCTEHIRNTGNNEIRQSNTEYPERHAKINIDIVPWSERDHTSDISEIDIYIDKNDPKEVESQSDDKSSDTFYSGLEDTNYPPSVSSTDYMALSSDREDSGIHTADVSCSVSQTDDIVEELDSNTNSHETVNDDFQSRLLKGSNNVLLANHILELTKENVIQQSNIEFQKEEEEIQYQSTIINSFEGDNLCISSDIIHKVPVENQPKIIGGNTFASNHMKTYEVRQEFQKDDKALKNINLPEIKAEILKVVNSASSDLSSPNFVFDSDFTLLPTKMVEPPKVKPPPPPVIDEVNVKRMNSTKRIKKEITLKRSNFLGLNQSDGDKAENDEFFIAASDVDIVREMEHSVNPRRTEFEIDVDKTFTGDVGNSSEIMFDNSTTFVVDEMTKREQEIIEMVEKAEKSRDLNGNPEEVILNQEQHFSTAPPKTVSPKTTQKLADASYHDKQPDYLDDQDSEVLKVEQELQQLEQEELKRKRDNLLFRQACSRVFAKNKRYSLENILDAPSSALECRKSMPELQFPKIEKESSFKPSRLIRPIQDVDLKYRKSVPNIPGNLYEGYHPITNDFQTIDKFETNCLPEFQHDIHRSAFDVPARKPISSLEIGRPANNVLINTFLQSSDKPVNKSEPPPIKSRNRNNARLKPRPNIEMKSYDQHWLYQEAELRRLQEKNYSSWQQSKILSESSIPNIIQRDPITPIHGSSKSSIKKLTTVNNDVQPYLEHHQPIGPPLPVSQTRSVAVEENQNRILSVSGKKKCSSCGNELGRGAAMIIETLCLFYHMECFKCCVCNVQLGNGLNGTDVRVRNQKLHCHNCYSSDDGIKFSCV